MYAVGTMIMSCEPRISVLSAPHLVSHCSGCLLSPHEICFLTGGKAPILKRCARCRGFWYCSAVRQVRHLLVSACLTVRGRIEMPDFRLAGTSA